MKVSRFLRCGSELPARPVPHWCRTAHVSSREYSGRPRRVLAVFGLVLGSASAVARAQDEGHPVMVERDGFTFDLRLGTGYARTRFDERDSLIADCEALAIAGGARFGWFIGPHVLLGAELAGSWQSCASAVRVRDESYFTSKPRPEGASYGHFAPLGIFIEFYPWVREGWYASLSSGVGGGGMPDFAEGDAVFMAGYAIELGYELSGAAKVGPAPFLRYSAWGAEESPISSEHPDGMASSEWLVGLRWSFWAPQWR